MTFNEFDELMEATYQKLLAMRASKGRDYAGNDDRLANFKRHAEQVDIDPLKIWAVYYNKHHDAIMTFVRMHAHESYQPSEPIEGRIEDAILYLFLLLGLIHDQCKQHISCSSQLTLFSQLPP